MKKRISGIIGILLSIIVLYFFSAIYYDGLYDRSNSQEPKVNMNNENDNPYNEPGTSDDSKVKSSELEEDNNDTTTGKGKNTLQLHARSAVLMDADNGRVLYEKDGYKEMPMASTTKIMTCIVTLENAKLDDVVTISRHAASMPDVQLNAATGEQYILKDLLYSLMLESHNDVAVAIAEHVGGSVEGFAKLMNKKAKDLGCNHTNFVTPNGLDAENHYTTAAELAKIASYAIKNPEFIHITNTSTWQFKELTKGRTFTVSNKDRFLYMYDGAIGVKTGFTGKAGFCFVGAVKKDNKAFVSSVLACGWPPNKSYKWSDTKKLMDYGMDNFELKQIFNADKKFNPVYVKDGKEEYVDLYYKGDISLLLGKDEKVKVVYKVPAALRAPVTAETKVGTAKYYVGKTLIQEVPILTKTQIDKIDFPFCFDKVKNIWLMK